MSSAIMAEGPAGAAMPSPRLLAREQSGSGKQRSFGSSPAGSMKDRSTKVSPRRAMKPVEEEEERCLMVHPEVG